MRFMELIRTNGVPTNVAMHTICCWEPHTDEKGLATGHTKIIFNGNPLGYVFAINFDDFTQMYIERGMV